MTEPPIFDVSGNPAAAPDLGAILASIGETAYAWDIRSDALTWDSHAPAVLGLAPAEVASGRSFARFLARESETGRFDAVMKGEGSDAGDGVAYEVQYALRMPGRSLLWLQDTGRWFAGPDGRPARAHGTVRVVTERHERDERLLFLSRFDPLTGDANRAHFAELLEAAIAEAGRLRGSCCLLLVAIDRLAQLNDAYGFDVADEVIAAVAQRLRGKLRGGDLIGRFSGNKFGVLLRNCTVDELPVAADRLAAGVRDDVILTSAGPVAVTVTAGGVATPRHAGNAADAIARTIEALYTARRKRAGAVHIYRPSIERDAMRRENARATDEIVAALNQRRILLAFEPVVDTLSRQPAFYESLIRILREDGTLIPAASIIPVAERLGLVRLLDHRVLELVIAELSAAPDLRLSLNVSPASTGDPAWWNSLDGLLRRHPGAGERLIVEITEAAEIRDIDETRGFVSRVKDRGCRIAIDDFGAGFTSFRNLRKLGVDMIKIDGSFVQNLTRSDDDRIFVRTLVRLGCDLGLSTVAEWVQCEDAAAMLREWGCDHLQGALIGSASPDRPWRGTPEERRAGAA